MDFTNAPGFQVFYYLVLAIIWLGLMLWLVKSAINSLKRTGGKVSSVLDEIVVGIIVTVGFVIFASLEPSVVFRFIQTPLMWICDIVLQLLRFVGVRI